MQFPPNVASAGYRATVAGAGEDCEAVPRGGVTLPNDQSRMGGERERDWKVAPAARAPLSGPRPGRDDGQITRRTLWGRIEHHADRSHPRAWASLPAIEGHSLSKSSGHEGVGNVGLLGDLRRGVHHHIFRGEDAEAGVKIRDRSPVAREGGPFADEEVQVAVRPGAPRALIAACQQGGLSIGRTERPKAREAFRPVGIRCGPAGV